MAIINENKDYEAKVPKSHELIIILYYQYKSAL